MALDVTPLEPLIGSRVRADPADLVAGIHGADLRALLVERGVLLFRDLAIDLEQMRAIVGSLGPLRPGAPGSDGLQKVTIDPAESPDYAAFFPTTFFWHLDGHFGQTVPAFGAGLRPARLPPDGGGETQFLSAYAAYDALPEDEKGFIDTLRVVHSQAAANAAAYPDAAPAEAAAWHARPTAVQPLVWQHASGRKSLMLGGSVSHVQGLHPADSFDLLVRLRAHMAQERFVYTHHWRMDDLLLWDNTGTLHRVRPFDPASGRLLNRFTIDGEEPIRAPA